ncbi:MAG TPA: type I restriction-modification system subunit M [Nitrososphaeraceae archaeon]|nr:type I restriction-modification system subunit M [Nitrososphaeraceae archaeon]
MVKLAAKKRRKEQGTADVVAAAKTTVNYTLFNQKITFDFLKSHLWAAADILRGSLDPADYRQPIMTLLFIKRLNDTFEENAEKLIKEEGRSEKEAYGNKNRHYFFISKEARWSVLSKTSENIGEKIDQVCRIIERENPDLDGVLTNTTYNDKRKFPDDRLRKLISHFNSPRLANSDLESTDIFGDAFEYLLEQFAEETKKSGGNFFTPKEIVRLLVNLVEPKEGMSICDPTCGSGGMLIECMKYVSQHGGNPRNLVLEGQEGNYGTLGMCKMNMVLHGLVDFKIEYGDTLSNPKLVEGGKLKTYEMVLANFPFSMSWDGTAVANDRFGRFTYGIPPNHFADFAFIQHIYTTLNSQGRAAIITPQGVLFRGPPEEQIRKRMVLDDVIDGIITLPANLFYGTAIPACVVLLNRNKSKERNNKIIFIYAARDFYNAVKRDLLRQQDIEKIVSAFKNYKDIDGYCHIAGFDEIEENEFNLNVPRYVDISKQEEEFDIQKTIDDLNRIEKERLYVEREVKNELVELGFKV